MVRPVVLMYHRVCADEDWRPSEFLVTASVFREQMRHLARGGYETPRLSEVLSGAASGSGGRTPVVLTFDDGFADLRVRVLPILRELGLTAAVFPVLDPGRTVGSWAATPALRAPLLTPADLRALEADGIELGSHTLTHPRLTRCDDLALARELSRSREILGGIAARPLDVVAYPYGDVDERVKRAARSAGYAAGLAVASGPLDLRADLFEIRRQLIANNASEAYLRMKLSGAEKVYAWSKWKLKSELGAIRHWRTERRAASAS